MNEQSGPSRLQALFEAALEDYEKQTGIALAKHPLAEQLQNCVSVESVTDVFREQTQAFNEFRGSDKILKSLKNSVSVLYKLTAAASFGHDVGLTLPPVMAIHTGLAILLSAVKGVIESYDVLIDLLESIENFLQRLDIYTKIPPTVGMTDMVVKILVELLSTLAVVTKQIKQGKSKKLVKKLLGEKDVEAVLQRLDRLTQDEARMTAAQTLEVVYGLIQNMRVVMDDGKASVDHVRDALEIMQKLASDTNKSQRDKLEQDVQRWLSPPDPWKNQNIAHKSSHRGSAEWFLQGDTYSEWKTSEAPGSLLWIHGKPGAGKSVLCSTIIGDIDGMRKAGLASLAFFYCDFREDQKKDLRGLLSSLLAQLCHQSDFYSGILSKLYSDHANGLRHPSDDVLVECLKDLLSLPGHAPIYLIVDALDECPNATSMPSPRDEVLNLIEDLIKSNIPNLHVCVTSRPETDIKDILEPLVLHAVSLHDESGQKRDIEEYINSVINTNKKNKRLKTADKQLVIDVLTEKADGMFRWVYCQMVYICGLIPARIRHALAELPDTLDETYERTLREINKAEWEIAHRLFQFVSVARRPLLVKELADLLAFDFEAGSIPKFHEDWRVEDPIDAVLSTCSSLLAIVDAKGSSVIQFSHFSVKEFLTSTRLAETRDIIPRRYHVSEIPAQTLAAQACLGILLHLDKDVVTSASLEELPLAQYAAEYWADYARLGDVSQNVEDGMKQLFDSRKPYLSVCIWIWDPNVLVWRQGPRAGRPSPLRGTFLHYAALWGLRSIVEFLIIEQSEDVRSQYFTGDVTPLHLASRNGHVEVVCFLLEHGADVTARDKSGSTPLHYASDNGHIEIVRILIKHGADVGAQNEEGQTSLHNASINGRVEVVCTLIEHGATVSAQGRNGSSPLHLALLYRKADVSRILIERGADVTIRDGSGWTPLHRASKEGQLEAARMILERGADIEAQNSNGLTPLHLAAEQRQLEAGRMLIERGANMDAQTFTGETSLYVAMRRGHVGFGRMLVECGADVTRRTKIGSTALIHASQCGDAEFVRMLIERGADVTAHCYGETPLHRASLHGEVEVIRVLIKHGANLGAQDQDGSTPLHVASQKGQSEAVRVLIEHGADVTAQNNGGSTPLHLASAQPSWSRITPQQCAEVARVLLEHGADRSAQDKNGRSSVDLASGVEGVAGVAQVFLEHRADAGDQGNAN